MESFPLLPTNENTFKKIVCGIYSIYDLALYRNDHTREWYNADSHFFSCILKNFVENRNIYLDEQNKYLLENGLKNIRALLLPTYKVYDYIVNIMNIAGIRNDTQQENYDFILNQPEFDFLREKNLLKKNVNRYMTETLRCYFIINYLYKNWNTIIFSENSENFYEEFIHYYNYTGILYPGTGLQFSEHFFKEIRRLDENPNKEKFILFYENLYKTITEFYKKWWCSLNLDLEEIIFLKNLKHVNNKIQYRTPIRVTNGIVVDCKYLYSQKSYKKNYLVKDMYNLYVLCTETGTIYITTFPVYRNTLNNTIGVSTEISLKKKKYFSQNDLYRTGLGTRLNISGRMSHRVMTPFFLIKNKKSFEFETVKIAHTRFNLPKTEKMENKTENTL